jgi:hypothetical protein
MGDILEVKQQYASPGQRCSNEVSDPALKRSWVACSSGLRSTTFPRLAALFMFTATRTHSVGRQNRSR